MKTRQLQKKIKKLSSKSKSASTTRNSVTSNSRVEEHDVPSSPSSCSSTSSSPDQSLLDDIQNLLDGKHQLYEMEMSEKERELAQLKKRYEHLRQVLLAGPDPETETNVTASSTPEILKVDHQHSAAENHLQILMYMSRQPRDDKHPNRWTYIIDLNISHQHLTSAAFLSLMPYIRRLKSMKTINLCHNVLDDSCVSALMTMLDLKLTGVDVSHNALGVITASLFATVLSNTSSSLQWLNIAGNPFAALPGIGAKLGQALHVNDRVIHFETTWTETTDVQVIGESASKTSTKTKTTTGIKSKKLTPSKTKTKSSSAVARNNASDFIAAWAPQAKSQSRTTKSKPGKSTSKSKSPSPSTSGQSPCTLLSLALTGAHLSPPTLIDLFKNFQSLTALDLSFSYIGYEGMQVLAAALKSNVQQSTLIQLNLKSNQIGLAGCQVLSHVLEENDTLTSLHLGNNGITDDGLWYLSNALLENHVLTCLDVSRNILEQEGCEMLLKLAQKHRQWTSFGSLWTMNTIPILSRHKLEKQLKKNQDHQLLLPSPETNAHEQPLVSHEIVKDIDMDGQDHSPWVKMKSVKMNTSGVMELSWDAKLHVHSLQPNVACCDLYWEIRTSEESLGEEEEIHPVNEMQVTNGCSTQYPTKQGKGVLNYSQEKFSTILSSEANRVFHLYFQAKAQAKASTIEKEEHEQEDEESTITFFLRDMKQGRMVKQDQFCFYAVTRPFEIQLVKNEVGSFKSSSLVHRVYVNSNERILIKWKASLIHCRNPNPTDLLLGHQWTVVRSRLGYVEENQTLHQGALDDLGGHLTGNILLFSLYSNDWQMGDVLSLYVSSPSAEHTLLVSDFQLCQQPKDIHQETIQLNFSNPNPFEPNALWA